ncbi:MAG: addiction module protein [Bdellovibrio sp.]|nr:MAG: addiction module protein [Bdellovibrio sp.]
MKVLIYEGNDGHAPYSEWLSELRDQQAAAKIEVRIRRIRLGNMGYWEPVGEGVGELKVDWGPGYRVYFGRIGATVVVLLCGGDKKTQKKDIIKAKEFWLDFKERYHGKED